MSKESVRKSRSIIYSKHRVWYRMKSQQMRWDRMHTSGFEAQDLSDNSTQVVSEENSALTNSQNIMTQNIAKSKDFSAEPIYAELIDAVINHPNTTNSTHLQGLGKVGLYKSPASLRIKRIPANVTSGPHSLMKSDDLINF